MHCRCSIRICFYLCFITLMTKVHGICIGSAPRTCLEDLEEDEAKEKLDYILTKYEEIDMKIAGEPVGLRGKRISRGEFEEYHIVFQLIDNKPYDILQTCDFVLSTAPGECEAIETVCNTFLPRTPRPLLQRKPLTVCEDGVREAEVAGKKLDDETTVTDAESFTDTNLNKEIA